MRSRSALPDYLFGPYGRTTVQTKRITPLALSFRPYIEMIPRRLLRKIC
jgi:hypothetical protein